MKAADPNNPASSQGYKGQPEAAGQLRDESSKAAPHDQAEGSPDSFEPKDKTGGVDPSLVSGAKTIDEAHGKPQPASSDAVSSGKIDDPTMP